MESLIKALPQSVDAVVIFVLGWFCLAFISLGLWVIREWLGSKKQEWRDLTAAVLANTMAVQKLEIQIESLNDSLEMIPKLRADIDAAHDKIRTMNQ